MRATLTATALRLLLLVGPIAGLLVAGAVPSAAAGARFREARLTIQIDALDVWMEAPANGPASGTLDASRTDTTLTSFTLPADALSVLGAMELVNDPDLLPITGLIGSFENSLGLFSSQGGALGGVMGLRFPGYPVQPGLLEVCLLVPCDFLPPFVLLLPLSVMGVGGEETWTVDDYSVTLTGAPWTSGLASVPLEGGGVATESGSLTVLGGGWIRVRLVTPLAIDWDGPDDVPSGIPSRIAAFGLLDLEVPEPGTTAAGAASLAALAALARRRQRNAQSAVTVSGTRSSLRSTPSEKVATR